MSIKSLYLLWCSLAFLSGCNSYDDKIAKYIDKYCPDIQQGDSCIFELKNATDFEWDRVYEFKGNTYTEDINKIIGFDCHCDDVAEDDRKIIFIKDDRIVMEDDYHDLGSAIQMGESFKNIISYSMFTPQTARFRVKFRKSDKWDWEYYALLPYNMDSLSLSR